MKSLGIIASYRDIDKAVWRADLLLPAQQKVKLKVQLDKLGLSITPTRKNSIAAAPGLRPLVLRTGVLVDDHRGSICRAGRNRADHHSAQSGRPPTDRSSLATS